MDTMQQTADESRQSRGFSLLLSTQHDISTVPVRAGSTEARPAVVVRHLVSNGAFTPLCAGMFS